MVCAQRDEDGKVMRGFKYDTMHYKDRLNEFLARLLGMKAHDLLRCLTGVTQQT